MFGGMWRLLVGLCSIQGVLSGMQIRAYSWKGALSGWQALWDGAVGKGAAVFFSKKISVYKKPWSFFLYFHSKKNRR